MTTNNAVNFANLATKTTPTLSDGIPISDQAAAGLPKDSLLNTFPPTTIILGIDNKTTTASVAACLPGSISVTQSDTQTVAINISINTGFWAIPFYVTESWAATRMDTIVKTGVAASTVTMGIYASALGLPTGAALTAASIATTASNTLVSATISVTLSPYVLYFAAIQASTSTTLALMAGLLNVGAPNILTYASSTGTWTNNGLGYTNTYSAGSLPTINPANLFGTSVNYVPLMRIR